MEKIDIIIPTKDHNEDLFVCLKSLNESFDTKQYSIEVIIVDDHSIKQSREELITNVVKYNVYKNLSIKTFFLRKNEGFAKACNIGLKYSLEKKKPAAYIGIMHDDVKVLENWVEKMMKGFNDNINVFCVGSTSLFKEDLHSVYELNVPELANYTFQEDEMHDIMETFLNKMNPVEVDKVQAFATLFKFDAIKAYGLLDEDNLTSINVEYKLCKKLTDDGRTIEIIPGACVVHKSRLLCEDNPNKLTYSKHVNVTEKINKIQNELHDIKKPYVIYTFVRDGEEIPMYKNFDVETFEYVCFTSNDILARDSWKYTPWKIYTINEFQDFFSFGKNSIKMKEFFKVNPQLFFNDFNISVWIDSMYKDAKNIDILIKKMNKDNFLLCGDSPNYDCSFKYLIDLKNERYMTSAEFDNVIQIYRWVNYPRDNGVLDSSVLIRKHNDVRCRNVSEKLWGFISKTFADDILFFNMVLWTFKYNYSYLPLKLIQSSFVEKGDEQ